MGPDSGEREPVNCYQRGSDTFILKREKAVQAAVLFGSHAAGHSRPESDVDVAVWLGNQLDSRQMKDARLLFQLCRISRHRASKHG